MRILVTGAAGFVGGGLLARLLDTGTVAGSEIVSLTAVDLKIPSEVAEDPRVRAVEGSIAEAQVRAEALADGPDVVFHLASVPGRATEEDALAGRAVNFDATVALLDAIAARSPDTRVVFTSSIGVFGVPLPDFVDDETYPRPTMSYGAQKLMAEVAFADMVRRRCVDGRCVRLSAIVARPPTARSARSYASFLSNAVFALAAGEHVVLPVSQTATAWLMSRSRCVDNLLHAAALGPYAMFSRPVCTLPALRVMIGDYARAIAVHYGRDAAHLVSFHPDPLIEAQFGAYPPARMLLAESLGFADDGSVEDLIRGCGGPASAGAAVRTASAG
jgi:nucleoside-diphosphate-sugar epimerase